MININVDDPELTVDLNELGTFLNIKTVNIYFANDYIDNE